MSKKIISGLKEAARYPMEGRFEILPSIRRKGEWFWRARAANNEILCTGETYKRHIDCRKAIKALQKITTIAIMRS